MIQTMEAPQIRQYICNSLKLIHRGICYHAFDGEAIVPAVRSVIDDILYQEGWDFRLGFHYYIADNYTLVLIINTPTGAVSFRLKHNDRLCFLCDTWFMITCEELEMLTSLAGKKITAVLYDGWDINICDEFMRRTRTKLPSYVKAWRDTFRSAMFITGIDDKVPVNSYLVALSETLTWVVPKKVFETLFQEVKI